MVSWVGQEDTRKGPRLELMSSGDTRVRITKILKHTKMVIGGSHVVKNRRRGLVLKSGGRKEVKEITRSLKCMGPILDRDKIGRAHV